MQQKSELPEGWVSSTLDSITHEIVRGPFGSALKKSFFVPSGYKVYEQKNVIYQDFSLGNYYVDEAKFHELKRFEIKPKDVVISCSGTVGKIAIVPDDIELGIINQALLKLSIDENVLFLPYFLKLFEFKVQRIVADNTRGSAMVNLSSVKDLKTVLFEIPPVPEQHRILSAIEAFLARLDATNEKLGRVQEIMKKFRGSILAAAFDGRLTEDWRKVNPEVESISSTISHMQSSEANLKNRANYKIKKIDESKLLNLPSKWEWHSIISVSNRVTVGHVGPMKDEYIEEGVPFLRSQNVRENRYDPSGLKYISHEFHSKIKKSALEPKDLVVVRSGNVGVSCVIPDFLKEANCSDLVVVKHPFGFVSEYGSYYLNSIAKSTIELNKVGIALSHFNTQSVANLPIPLPPLSEQQEIVRRVDALFAFADSIEAKVTAAREKTEKLRQSILAKAFSGQLVETEAEIARREGRDYETAEVLIERIKEEKGKEKEKMKLF